jgi:lysozyme
MSRSAIFAAVRSAARPGLFDDPGNVLALDNLLDALGVPRESEQRRINKAGLDLIKSFEGLELKAYLCPAKVWTIGYGSTGPHVKPGMVITEAEAERLLREDLERFEACVAKAAPGASDNEFAAMVSLAFNIGEDGFRKSTVLRKHLAGDHLGAASAFAMWVKGGGRTLPGLVRRRAAEAQLYRSVS